MKLIRWLKSLRRQQPAAEVRFRILAVAARLDDRFLLERLGKRHHWELRFADAPAEGFSVAARTHFDVILCDSNQPGYPWREVMDRLAASSPESCILLVAPKIHDYVWRDVREQGGYDILLRPLREEAVLRVMESQRLLSTPEAGQAEAPRLH